MNRDFCADIQQQIISAISKGKRHFVYWGVNENCIQILYELNKLGLLESYTSGIVDSVSQKQGKKIYKYEVLPPEQIKYLDMDVLVITSDAEKEDALKAFSKFDTRFPEVLLSGTAHFRFKDPVFDEILGSCLVKSYANGYENSLIHIYQSIKYLAANNIKGNVAEFGIFKGGTIVFIAKALERFGYNDCKIYGFDIFEGFPTRKTVFDLYSNPDCEFHDFAAVEEYCSRYKIEVIKGDICETYKTIENVPLMLSFFDTDNYSPTRAALETCFQQTVKGGVLAFDHYVSEQRFLYTIGERIAAKEVLARKNVFHLHGTGIFIKC
jgi:hypothetical protein